MSDSKLSLFEQVVSISNTKYIDHCKKKKVKKSFVKLLNENDRVERKKIWNSNFASFSFNEISNPYFLGTGNPKSEILIIGKELGFDKENNCQFYNEVVQNSFDWKELLQEKNIVVPDYYNPRKPYNGHYLGLPSGHTWRKYNMVVSMIINKTCNLDNSFFNYCFLTEFNILPSKYSNGKHKLSEERKEFLKHDFFKSFKYIILTYKAYDKDNPYLTEKIFDVNFIKHNHFGKQAYFFYKNAEEKRTVILTNQLSGMAGWTDDELQQLSNLLKQ
ncbi:MAG: hypothetical protein R2764_19390 [Bacteroidales bacterium]